MAGRLLSENCPVTLSSTSVLRNSDIFFTVNGLAPAVERGTAHLNSLGARRSAPVQMGGKVGFLRIPVDQPLGHYTVTIELGPNMLPACGLLDVRSAFGGDLQLHSLEPTTSYEWETVWTSDYENPKTATSLRTIQVTLRGTGFLTETAGDNVILVNQDEWQVNWDGCDRLPDPGTSERPVSNVIHGKVVTPERIDLCRVPIPPDGHISIAVKQGDLRSSALDFRLYRWSMGLVAAISGFTALSLGLVVIILVRSLRPQSASPQRKRVLEILFLDPETDTYSLSKFQFYLWTSAALFGYTYLVISRMFVQGQTWPDIPASLPGLIAIGAGSSIGAQFISALKGPKGSGTDEPSWSDLVTSGGLVAPERVQMFVWTIFGVGSFCLAVLRHGPGTINTLDPIPSGMLYMMGLSSAGYLGGKLARTPGPIINRISITSPEVNRALIASSAAVTVSQAVVTTPEPAILVIELRGRNLSTECLIEIDNVELPSRMLVPNEDNQRAPQIVVREPNNPSLARIMRLSIDPILLMDSDRLVYNRWFAKGATPKQRTLTLINPDGQRADVGFSVPSTNLNSPTEEAHAPDSSSQSSRVQTKQASR
jgi:hypothetical protein